jgi:hypothetical protein
MQALYPPRNKDNLLATNLGLIERQQSPTGERHCHGTKFKSDLLGVNRKMSLCSHPPGSEQTLPVLEPQKFSI